MTPALASLIIALVQELVRVAPGAIQEIRDVLSKPDATPADWDALRARVAARKYEDYDPGFVPPVPPAG